MVFEKIEIINNWEEDDLKNIPIEENDNYEFKSSRINLKDLKKEISIAASAFWNSGGGLLIVGFYKGNIDGGIPSTVGNQEIRDWVDQAISLNEPLGLYNIKTIKRKNDNSLIEDDKSVLIIAFPISNHAPHMAYDKKYYIRAGAHSYPASHFIVEAIRTRRNLVLPKLKGLLKFKSNNSRVVQLLIVSLNDSPSIDVNIGFDDFPIIFHEDQKNRFPIEIPLIDKNNPFIMDFYIYGMAKKTFGENPIKLILKYKDILDKNYEEFQIIDPKKCFTPITISDLKNKK